MGGKKNLKLAYALSVEEFDCCGKVDCDLDGDVIEIDGEEIKECPLKLVTGQSRLLIYLRNMREHGVLPEAGGLMDQPNIYTSAMLYLDYLQAEHRKNNSK